ncbi:hypothetical protein NGTWS1803_31520 [Mycolicibacterium cyprinidarum]|nr:hypothetical protein NGTWS1803_31520 [Mycolicibacterium sp. NGTWS1803]
MSAVGTVLFVGVGGREADSARFDEATHTWTLGGRRARVLVASDGALPFHLSNADGLDPYLGVAVHGIPNYFLITGPDAAAQKSYIAKCLNYLSRTGNTRIEVRSSTQRYFNERPRGGTHRRGRYWRRVARRIPSAFEVSSLDDENDAADTVYDGPATVNIDGQSHEAWVRLTGHIDPIDGHYHWQGRVFDTDLDIKVPREVIVAMNGRAAPARLTERTPQSTYSVAGVGAPPFQLDEVEVEVPLL